MTTTELFNGSTAIQPDVFRQPKTFQGPLLGFLLAATLFAKASQARPYLLGNSQPPALPYRPLYNYFPSLWYPNQGSPTTTRPQILAPPLSQQQIIHIHDPPTTDESEEEKTHEGDVATTTEDYLSTSPESFEINFNSRESSFEFDNNAESSNRTYEIVSFYSGNSNGGNRTELEPKIRSKRAPQRRKGAYRRPSNYDDGFRNRRRPVRRRTTTPQYGDYFDRQSNRRKRRPPSRNKNRGNRRPGNREPDYYDSAYRDDYYDEDYLFARQQENDEDTTESSSTPTGTTNTGSTPTGTPPTGSPTPPYNHTGYGYGPPNTGYGPPQTGYGPSNGNEHISITYAPPSAPNRDYLAPIIDAWYNQYSKSSVLRRLQELLQPNNFYNNQQYDVNYQDTF